MLEVLFKEWARNNPEQASAIANTIGIIETALTEAARQLVPIIEVLCPENTAARFKKRYEETGVVIQIDEAVRLAFLLLAHRIPYTGPDPRPDGIIGTLRDQEMLACDALLNGNVSTLIEDSTTNPVAYGAVQEVLRHLRTSSKEIPSELQEWSYDVTVGDRRLPRTGPGRNPFTNQVRNAAITQTMEILISCGLKATRNEASKPTSAADAVSIALEALGVELQTESVSKIWGTRART